MRFIAAYLINQMPLVPLGNETPYEKLFDRKPNNTNFKAFGCLAFVSTIKQKYTQVSIKQMAFFTCFTTGMIYA